MARKAGDLDAAIGARIRKRRLELGLSMGAVACELGITFQQVRKYEVGKSRVGASTLVPLSHALRVRVEYFFEGVRTWR
jgi:transcriptional regulator with XRE-family HTH domain